MRIAACYWFAALVLLPALSATAGLVQPGQSVTLLADDVPAPAGTLLAQKSTPFTIDYGAPTAPFNITGKLTGSLYSAVYRDQGHLTFVYDVDLNNLAGVSGAAEASELRVGSFKSFKTALFGSMDFESLVRGSRTENGAQLWITSSAPGLGGAPRMVVHTNATAFDANGHASFFAADDVPTLSGSRLAAGSANVNGIFRPAVVNSASPPILPVAGGSNPGTPGAGGTGVPSGGSPSPTPIPLPPAVYSALGVLLAMGLLTLARRGWPVQR